MHTDVTTRYLGLELRSPVIAGACPLNLVPETVRELAIAGAGAVVMPSLMQEQLSRNGGRNECERAEIHRLADQENDYNRGVEAYMKAIPLLKQQSGIPVIASLNGCSDGDWLSIADEVEMAGADAIELSINCTVCDPSLTAEQVERPLLQAVQRVSDSVSIPVAVKLLPFYTSLPNLGWRLAEMGASGVVLFGREPVWEISEGDLVPSFQWHLSSTGQLQTTLSGLIRLRSGGPAISVAASGGISTTVDVIHSVTAGADVAMVASEIYRNGPDAVAHIVDGLTAYLQRNGYDSYDTFVAERKQLATQPTRSNQVEPMLHPPQDHPSPRVSTQHGDRWGHADP